MHLILHKDLGLYVTERREYLRWRVRSLTRRIIHSCGYHNYAQAVRLRKPRVI